MLRPRRRSQSKKRRGVATVELAFLLPIMTVIVFGAIEGASMIFLRQALVQSSYEATKVAVKTGDKSAATNAALAVTQGREIDSVQITFEPDDIASLEKGKLIRITVSAPGDSNSILPLGIFKGRTVAAAAAMVKE